MATSRTMTVTDILGVNPTLRLTLKNKAGALEARKNGSQQSLDNHQRLPTNNPSPSTPGVAGANKPNPHLESARQSLEGMCEDVKKDLGQDENVKASPEGTKRRIKKVQASFQKIKSRIDEEQERIIALMPTMTASQQSQVLGFWEAMTDFFLDLFQWVEDVFTFFLEKIRQGHKFNAGALKACFDEILKYFKQIF